MTNIPFSPFKRCEARGEGRWALTGRLLLGEGAAPLADCLDLLAEDHPRLQNVPRLEGEPPRPGDLVLRLGRPEELEEFETFGEGFAVEAGPWTEITAQSERAAVFGLRSVLEALETGPLAYGRFLDWPDTGERGLHLDMGRKFFSKDWILDLLRDLSRSRMNTLWLHFSETEGFRIACESHPEVPSLLHLTKEEVREILRLGRKLRVDVCPALDCPGHLGQALQEHPRWQLPRKGEDRLHSALDITNADARRFLLDLVDEYAELFAGAPVFHIGGDEFIDFRQFDRYPVMEEYAKAHIGPQCGGADAYVDFLNQVAAHVRAKGFQVRVWNDGLLRLDVGGHVPLDPEVQIAYWSSWDKGMAPLRDFLDRGYRVINYNARSLYYILYLADHSRDPDPEKILRQWSPALFPTHPVYGPQALSEGELDRLAGCCYSIWCDWPDIQTPEEVRRYSRDSLAAFARRCWSWR